MLTLGVVATPTGLLNETEATIGGTNNWQSAFSVSV
jgi:hypothetical protein